MQGELPFTQKLLMEDEYFNVTVQWVYRLNDIDIGDLWLSFLEITDILVQNIHICHSGNI